MLQSPAHPLPPPSRPKIIKTILERWVIRREVQDNVPPNSNKKGKDSYHSHSEETKNSLYHGNNQNKNLKGDNLTDSHTRKATFAKGVNKIDSKESLPTPFPEQFKYTNAQTNKQKTKQKITPTPQLYIYIHTL